MTKKICILNYGLGNILSLKNALNYLGYRVIFFDRKNQNFDLLLIPGVGSFHKASLIFILGHKNGSLANILNILSNYDMNLTKIQSIPIIETPWKYSFFIDTTFTDIKKYKKAIENVSSQSEYVKEFGVYDNFKSQ